MDPFKVIIVEDVALEMKGTDRDIPFGDSRSRDCRHSHE